MASDLLLLLLGCADPGTKPHESGSDSTPTTDSLRESRTTDSTRTESVGDSPLTEPCEDEGAYYQDVDGDGYGARREWQCEPAPGWVDLSGDCDDTDPDVHPGAEDVLDNDVDEDCDGLLGCGEGRIYHGDLVFTGDSVEEDLAAFCEEWDMVDGWLEIVDAPTLTSLESLSCLCYVDALVVWDGCPVLTSARGLEGFSYFDVVSINLADAPDMMGLQGLEAAGDLSLGGVRSLGGLERLHDIGSSLYLSGTFTDFTGLERLAVVGGGVAHDLNVFQVDSPNLTSFAGLDSLHRVEVTYMDIDTHGNEPTEGFARLDTIDGELHLKYAPSPRGYETVQSVRRLDAGIGWDSVLTNLDGLGGLEEVTDDLAVNGVEDVDGLSGLTRLPSTEIGKTALLTHLDGLTYVTEVDGDLFIYQNEALESLDGLHRVERITGGLIIEDNPNLPDAEIDELIRHIGEGNIGYISIGVNGG